MKIRKILFFTCYYLREFLRINSVGLLIASFVYLLSTFFWPFWLYPYRLIIITTLCLLPFSLYFLVLPKRKKYLLLDQELKTGELFLTRYSIQPSSPYKEKMIMRENSFIKTSLGKLFFKKFPLRLLVLSTTILIVANLLSGTLGSAYYTDKERVDENLFSSNGNYLGIPEQEEGYLPPRNNKNIFNIPQLGEDLANDGTPQRDAENIMEEDEKTTPYSVEEELRKSLKTLTEELTKNLKSPTPEIKEKLAELDKAVKEQNYEKTLALLNPLIKMLEEGLKGSSGVSLEEKEGETEPREGSGTVGAGSGPAIEASPSKGTLSNSSTQTETNKLTAPYSTIRRKKPEENALTALSSIDELKLFKDIFTLKLRPTPGIKEELNTRELLKLELSRAEALLFIKSAPLPTSYRGVIRSYFELISP